ncbi:hypothetical protein WDZ16_01310 [Pseudokineococcus marinus]|uniref:Uncharacterized protein n=1 Tax=Pseudokineococcus marinus TaxID=351215 RepID=A0A849BPN4_9ACTN|nr:hypothetical protein [Pseudokineococcus marinus]NNH21516.1 hypothetical protein [Pseudokineococcus marinus]
MRVFDGSTPGEWAERVRREVVRQLDPQTRPGGGGHFDANGAYLLSSWSSVVDDVPVLHLVYRHPWWGFATGLRRELDGDVLANHSGDPAVNLADDIVIGDVGEPLGRNADLMVPDADGVWWWGDDPLLGDRARRGPAPSPG